MYGAEVFEVLVASPSDTGKQRETIREAIIRWNATESRHLGIALLPVMWETHTYPDLGQPAQPSINKQIVDDADILIATFWTTLGTPTSEADSGTVEEIERFKAADKSVLLYFCDIPTVPLDNDQTSIERLRAYKEKIKREGFFSSYQSYDELSTKVRDDLTRLIHDKGDDGNARLVNPHVGPRAPGGANDSAAKLAELQRELRGYAAKWETMFATLVGDFSVDKRLALATEIERVTLEFVRLVSVEAPGANVLRDLSLIAARAAGVANTRVYMDGGVSFQALTNGCDELVSRVSSLASEDWITPSE